MCGICGVIQVEGEPRPAIDPDVLDRMTDAMVHRGPNDRGIHLEDGIALGVRRLSIVDVLGGHQPVRNEDGRVWAIQNGELYNHADLRRELSAVGHTFRSNCDTEVLPHLYEREGSSFPTRLRGKFAIAVWDRRRRRAVVARDRLGIKPLYYARSGDVLVFASELKSLLSSGLVEPDLDYDAIDVYLDLGYFVGPRTPLAGVRKLMPGESLVVESGAVRLERYWAYPKPHTAPIRRSETEWTQGFLAELDEAVRLRLMSDVPLGAMLSGGLDSSLIVALMARHMTEPVKTFAIGFREAGEDNELADARYVASVFGTEHHELELSYSDAAVDLEEFVWFLDEPVADLSALGFHALSQLAARHVTVALAGQGADELFGGYTKHAAAAAVGKLQRILGRATPAVAAFGSLGTERVRRFAASLAASEPADRLLASSGRMDARLRAELLQGPLGQANGSATRAVILDRQDGVVGDPLATLLYLDGQLALVDDMIHYFDRNSMAHSLEVRVPFLDHRVVEYCAGLPSGLKVKGLTRKYLLKRAARGLVPDRIIEKRKLGFFRRASNAWLDAQMPGAVAEHLLGSSPRVLEFLRRPGLERLIASYREGAGAEHVHLLIAILMLEIWLSTYLPRFQNTPQSARERIVIPG
jgi:asparagine synthase (glutamine-hydrolysing)